MAAHPPSGSAPPQPAQVAKAALLRLAQSRTEPTPEQFRIAYEAEWLALGGAPPAAAAAPWPASPPQPAEPAGLPLAELIRKLTRGMERHHRQWTHARKKDSLQRVLDGSASHEGRLRERLTQLLKAWDADEPDAPAAESLPEGTTAEGGTPPLPAPTQPAPVTGTHPEAGPPSLTTPSTAMPDARSAGPTPVPSADATALNAEAASHQGEALDRLKRVVHRALSHDDPQAREARDHLDRTLPPAAAPLRALHQACHDAERVIEQRQRLVDQLTGLCRTLTDSLTELSEDDSWVQGQCALMRRQFDEGMNSRSTRLLHQLLADTREKQAALRQERLAARDALKHLVQQMLVEIAGLGDATDRFQTNLLRYADTIEQADSLPTLAGLVKEMVEESRSVHGVIRQAQDRLSSEHARAIALTDRVRELEDEIRQLSAEVSTDPLTQIANRRGLISCFEAEQSRIDRQQSGTLCIGLIDVDNFKKLNDTLGHQTGDEALKFLATRITDSLRPHDRVARYGGEEFVVLLPDTEADDAVQVLTRLQRQLSAEFFIHDENKVFITFSAGVTPWRPGETLESALDRADMGLYEAKRTGKNRTCLA